MKTFMIILEINLLRFICFLTKLSDVVEENLVKNVFGAILYAKGKNYF